MLGAVVLEHAAQIAQPREQQHVAEEDRCPDDPLDDPEQHRGVQLALDQARERDRDHEEQADREHERHDDRPRPHATGDLLALRRLSVRFGQTLAPGPGAASVAVAGPNAVQVRIPLRATVDRLTQHPLPILGLAGWQLRVGGDPERAEPDRHRLPQRHHPAHDRQAQRAVALQRGGEGKRRDLDLPFRRLIDRALVLLQLLGRRLAHRHRPVGDAAHHHALEHRLPADGGVALGVQLPVAAAFGGDLLQLDWPRRRGGRQ